MHDDILLHWIVHSGNTDCYIGWKNQVRDFLDHITPQSRITNLNDGKTNVKWEGWKGIPTICLLSKTSNTARLEAIQVKIAEEVLDDEEGEEDEEELTQISNQYVLSYQSEPQWSIPANAAVEGLSACSKSSTFIANYSS